MGATRFSIQITSHANFSNGYPRSLHPTGAFLMNPKETHISSYSLTMIVLMAKPYRKPSSLGYWAGIYRLQFEPSPSHHSKSPTALMISDIEMLQGSGLDLSALGPVRKYDIQMIFLITMLISIMPKKPLLNSALIHQPIDPDRLEFIIQSPTASRPQECAPISLARTKRSWIFGMTTYETSCPSQQNNLQEVAKRGSPKPWRLTSYPHHSPLNWKKTSPSPSGAAAQAIVSLSLPDFPFSVH